MPKIESLLYDTRFFVEHFYSNNEKTLAATRAEIQSSAQKLISVITLHEFYRLNLERQGREVARLRTNMISDNFRSVDVNSEISVQGAELRKKYSMPMGDSLIAATARVIGCTCITDDPHLKIKEIRSRWIRS
ncbi:MAG: PIN domain-containing protein [Thaumarchaeota archaeon]|nr:PIN domain-containing protein [Nitrososphaerota archaeon]MCL5066899.1 PIN domain-containing protein [Nitrososphaerota archaeon]